ncbi:cystatin-like 1 isoform X2 [Panthera tigris]|uniref:cystatin-like 1 isoform X2 n=1 Tax=Panthera leo TaxID=9689 RepID=UPI001C69918B|nr:cystatin-like 1 isoform X2 [Panthera leo]XP_042836939.1 cystatin-like 1 isoform X2 [Panthera tigris]
MSTRRQIPTAGNSPGWLGRRVGRKNMDEAETRCTRRYSEDHVYRCGGYSGTAGSQAPCLASLILGMQGRELTTGVEYMVTVKISRTKCERNGTRNHSCPIQNKKKLKKSFICDFLVYTVPWMNYYQLWNNSCLEA